MHAHRTLLLLAVAAGAALAAPWDLPTARELVFRGRPPGAPLLAGEAAQCAAASAWRPLALAATGIYAATAAAPDQRHYLAVWSDALVSGEVARLAFDRRMAGFVRLLTNDAAARTHALATPRVTLAIGRAPLVLLCANDPAQWLPRASARRTQPLELAARVELRDGALLFGARNTTRHPIAATIRIVSADGATLPVSSFGCSVPPGKLWLRYLPVRDVTRDEPVLDCLVVLHGMQHGYAQHMRLICRSGALFRDNTAEQVSAGMPRHAPFSLHTTPSAAREWRVDSAPVITGFAAAFGSADPLPWSYSNATLFADALAGGTRLARTSLAYRANDRGDFVLNALTDITAEGLTTNDVPALCAAIPAALLREAVIAAQRDGAYIFTSPAALADPGIAAEFSGPAVNEWAVVTPRDWLCISLDAAQLGLAYRDDGLHLRITSRTPWLPPFTLHRAHAVQLRLHLPVGILAP